MEEGVPNPAGGYIGRMVAAVAMSIRRYSSLVTSRPTLAILIQVDGLQHRRWTSVSLLLREQ